MPPPEPSYTPVLSDLNTLASPFLDDLCWSDLFPGGGAEHLLSEDDVTFDDGLDYEQDQQGQPLQGKTPFSSSPNSFFRHQR